MDLAEFDANEKIGVTVLLSLDGRAASEFLHLAKLFQLKTKESAEGLMFFEIFIDSGTNTDVLFSELWQDSASLKNQLNSTHLAEFREETLKLKVMLAPPKLTFYRVQ